MRGLLIRRSSVRVTQDPPNLSRKAHEADAMNNMAPAFLFLPEAIPALHRAPPRPAHAGTLQSPHSPPSAAVEELPLKSRPAAGRLRSADLFPSSGYLLAPSFAEGCWGGPNAPPRHRCGWLRPLRPPTHGACSKRRSLSWQEKNRNAATRNRRSPSRSPSRWWNPPPPQRPAAQRRSAQPRRADPPTGPFLPWLFAPFKHRA